MQPKTRKEKTFIKKLHNKYRLVIMNDDTFEEKLSFRLTRFNVFVFFGTLSISLVIATIYLIAFTPLREFIPGYADFDTRRVLRELHLKTDSLYLELRENDLFLQNIRNIMEGREPVDRTPEMAENAPVGEVGEFRRSREDSILRAEIERQSINVARATESFPEPPGMTQFFFFPPMQGIITGHFNAAQRHFGIDIVADLGQPIKATLEGTVILSTWTIETGYTIGIQHANNLVSVYKHNSTLLKEEGAFVQAGDVIAIIGNTGTLSTGTHLHFELWFNGNPVNPVDYIVF